MAILLHPFNNVDEWQAHLQQQFPEDEILIWPDVGRPQDVEFVVAWVMKREALASFVNLRAILSLGAGAEQWMKPGMPDVPIVRLADPQMSNEMATYALHWVIRHQRQFGRHTEAQADTRWEAVEYTPATDYRVGILGYGNIGRRIGDAFLDLGYVVNSWSRSGGNTPGVSHYAGLGELEGFLAHSDAVINVLPSNESTTGLLTVDRLRVMPESSIFVNIGRGTVLDSEDDLMSVLDAGPLSAAVLDVTSPEPPAPESKLWTHPKVRLTPHVAGATLVSSATALLSDNIRRIRAGEEPFPVLDVGRGY